MADDKPVKSSDPVQTTAKNVSTDSSEPVNPDSLGPVGRPHDGRGGRYIGLGGGRVIPAP
jgi:hypothetical protein